MKNFTLSDREWKEFVIEDIFAIRRGSRYVKSRQLPGDYPYVSSTGFDNGVDNFTVPTKKNKLHEGFIGINNSGSVGLTFYHPYKAVVSDHVTICKNEQMRNMFIGVFLATVLESCNKDKYSFNYEINNKRLKRTKVLLPVNSEGSPDYDFMEEYMRQFDDGLNESLLREINIDIKTKVLSLDDAFWEEYTIEEAFDSVKSSPYSWDYSSLKEDVRKNAEIPYVTRTARNNGISSWIKDMTEEGYAPIEGNCFTIGLDTGTINYQPMAFYTGQNIHIVRDRKLNKYNAFFILPLIGQSLDKFNWGGFSATLGRFSETKIMLPSTNGGVDWEFMDKYVRSLQYAELL